MKITQLDTFPEKLNEKLLSFNSDSSVIDDKAEDLEGLNQATKEAALCKKYGIKSCHPKNRSELLRILSVVFATENTFKGLDLNWIDVSNIQRMNSLFDGWTDFNCDISKWDVSNVINMASMFDGCWRFSCDISKWNVSKVEYMGNMFSGCSIFNQDLSSWDVSNVADMYFMFSHCDMFNSDLSRWDVSNVKNMSGMFFNCSNFNQDLSNWNVSNVKDRKKMFLGCPIWPRYMPKFNVDTLSEKLLTFNADSSVIDNKSEELEGLTQVTKEAALCKKYGIKSCHPKTNDELEEILNNVFVVEGKNYDLDLNWIDVSKITDMSYLTFGGMDSIRKFNCDISKWDVSNVKDMEGLFAYCVAFNQDISNWNVSKVKDMNYMFNDCEKFNQDLSRWNVSNVKSMAGMFSGCRDFNQDLSRWNVSNVRDMSYMFASCKNFNQDLSKWNVSNVKDGKKIFVHCPILPEYEPKFNVGSLSEKLLAFNADSSVIDTENEIDNLNNIAKETELCKKYGIETSHPKTKKKLEEILSRVFEVEGKNYDLDLNWIDVSQIDDMTYLKFGNHNFNCDISKWDVSNVKFMEGTFTNCAAFNQDLNNWNVSNVLTMEGMFYGCTAFNGDISKWDVHNVIDMASMFNGCENFNCDISEWDVSNVEDMSYMFLYCKSFNRNISNWDLRKLIKRTYIFFNCPILPKYKPSFNKHSVLSEKLLSFNSDSSVIDANELGRLNQVIKEKDLCKKYGIKTCHPKELEDLKEILARVFITENKYEGLDLNWIDVSNITSFERLMKDTAREMTYLTPEMRKYNFDKIGAIQEFLKSFNCDISEWDVHNAKNMMSAFSGCTNFNCDISKWDVSNVETMRCMFYRCKSFNQDLNNWNVSNVITMHYMFFNCTNFNGDISKWDVSNVRNMSGMFDACENFNCDISEWDVSNVNQKSYMFNGCTKFNQDLSKWNFYVPEPGDFIDDSEMSWSIFNNCPAMLAAPEHLPKLILNNINFYNNKNVSEKLLAFNTDSSVIDTNELGGLNQNAKEKALCKKYEISSCHPKTRKELEKILENVFRIEGTYKGLELNWIDVSRITDMSNLFSGTYDFNCDISKWDVSNVRDMSGMFINCENFNQDLSKWDVSKVEKMYYMFYRCLHFNQDLSKWDVSSNVEGLLNAFTSCPIHLEYLPKRFKMNKRNLSEKLLSFSTDSSVIDAEDSNHLSKTLKEAALCEKYSIKSCHPQNKEELEKLLNRVFEVENTKSGLDLNWIDVSNVEFMNLLFAEEFEFDCDISKWDVSNVVDMRRMFFDCKKFNQDLSGWNVSKVVDMSYMFSNCEKFDQDLSKWDVSNVRDMNYMFVNCKNFNQDLSKWNVSNVTDISYIFFNCKKFNQDLSGWDDSKIINSRNAFYDCPILPEYQPKNFKNSDLSEKLLSFSSDSSIIDTESSGIDILTKSAAQAVALKKYGLTSCKATSWPEINDILNTVFTKENRTYDIDLNWIDVSELQDFGYLFFGREDFNCDISKWDVSKAKDMSFMFTNCENFNQDISKWNVSNVVSMDGMFKMCKNFNCDIGEWDVSNVTDMRGMFYGCKKFNQDLSSWKIANVTKNMRMFNDSPLFHAPQKQPKFLSPITEKLLSFSSDSSTITDDLTNANDTLERYEIAKNYKYLVDNYVIISATDYDNSLSVKEGLKMYQELNAEFIPIFRKDISENANKGGNYLINDGTFRRMYMDGDPFLFVTPFDITFEGDTGPQIDGYALISRKDWEHSELYSYLGKDKHYLFENTPFEKFDFCYRHANKNFIIIGKEGLSNAFNSNEKPYKLVSDEWVLYDILHNLMRNKTS